jgi:hypothetical protein
MELWYLSIFTKVTREGVTEREREGGRELQMCYYGSSKYIYNMLFKLKPLLLKSFMVIIATFQYLLGQIAK